MCWSVFICNPEKLQSWDFIRESTGCSEPGKAIVDKVLHLTGTSHPLLAYFSLLNGTEHFSLELPFYFASMKLPSTQAQSQRMLILIFIWKSVDCWIHGLTDEMRTAFTQDFSKSETSGDLPGLVSMVLSLAREAGTDVLGGSFRMTFLRHEGWCPYAGSHIFLDGPFPGPSYIFTCIIFCTMHQQWIVGVFSI